MAWLGGRLALLCGAALALSACVGGPDGPRPDTRSAPPPVAEAAPAPASGQRIGTGSVKVALIVPLTGQGAAVGAALRNAANSPMTTSRSPTCRSS